MSPLPALKQSTLSFLLLIILATANGAEPTSSTNDSAAPFGSQAPFVSEPVVWTNASAQLNERVHDLLRRMSLREKVSQICADPEPIPRLGIPAYSHRNECLHGVANGVATVFPQAIGMAATWDLALIRQEADVIATEARAKHNDYAAKHNGESIHFFGLNFYSPNINIFRDPRWGRGQETYGEDPFLTGQMGVAFITGLQGNDPRYFKTIAGAKHYAVHSGPEVLRHRFDARPPERDLYETYLPAFEAAVREGHVGSIMGAYSALYDVPDCANYFLLTELLRKQWGFNGFVVSDGGAIWDIWHEHKYTPTPQATAAAAVKAGCDLCSGNVPSNQAQWSRVANGWQGGGVNYIVLTQAVQEGLITEPEIDTAVTRELTARFQLGLFDPPPMVPWSNIGMEQNDTPQHQALALKVARESIVLLKNDGLLPLNRSKLKRIAVIGPNADSTNVLHGNYSARASHPVSILSGISELAGTNITVVYAAACPLALRTNGANKPLPEKTAEAVAAAKAADVIIYVGGIDPSLESEEANARAANFDGFYRGDRTRIELPSVQEDLLKALHATRKPVVFVNCSGSAIAMPWASENLNAIIQAWYPGEEGGRAVAQVLFGDVNPAGRLPISFYRSTEQLPPYEDYSMSNRTYRYFTGKPLFAFGYGLSYSKFGYSNASLNKSAFAPKEILGLSFFLKNNGKRDGDEVAQVYVRHINSSVPQPKLTLCGFARTHLLKGQGAKVTMSIPAQRFRSWDTAQKKYVLEPGQYELLVAAASDDVRLRVPFEVRAEKN